MLSRFYHQLILFGLTALPLVVAPGPDLLFIASQGLTAGKKAVLKANAGILSGYCMHAILSALGISALIATSHILFMIIRWVGVIYLLYLAIQMIRSAFQHGALDQQHDQHCEHQFRKGFMTSFLNPKGLLLYLAILPNFIDKNGNYALQALALASVFIVSCAIFYTTVGLCFVSLSKKSRQSRYGQRIVKGISGSILLLAAGYLVRS